MKKTNIFLVYTEYHLMYAISVITQSFSNESEYRNLIVLSQLGENRRLSKGLNDHYINGDFIYLDGHELGSVYAKSDVELMKSISKMQVETLVSFLDNTPYFYYLHHRLKKKGTRIVLGPDGAKPYKSIDGNTFLSQMKYTVFLYFDLLKRGLTIPYLLKTSDKIYAKSKLIDELWIPFNSKLKTNKQIEIKEHLLIPNRKVLDTLVDVFNVKNILDKYKFKDSIFYVNHPFPLEIGYEMERKVLNRLFSIFKDKSFFFKPHPHTPIEQIEFFTKLERAVVIKDEIPAELMLGVFEDSIIVSFWSTTLLTNNKSCQFYWLLDYLNMELEKPMINLPVYPKHIKRLEKISDIKNN